MHRIAVLALAAGLAAGPVQAQEAAVQGPLPVGAAAPDFTLLSATRLGQGELVSLRDFKGQVVVIAFFYRARTAG